MKREKMPCNENQYEKNGLCCDRCPAGTYVQKHCNATTRTVCANCKEGFYTATANNLPSCQICTVCSSDNKLTTEKKCSAKENTVCRCIPGLYCHNHNCDHCLGVTPCDVGEGVKFKANRTENTVCERCGIGTFSNVTDDSSPCKPHTSCGALGRELKTKGTSEIDAVCGNHLSPAPPIGCQWMLPAGLWAGLVLTALILFAFVIYRKARRRSYRADTSRRNVTLVKTLDLNLPATTLDLSLADPKEINHCQESCATEDIKIPLFTQDENLHSCNMDSSLPITPLKVSVSFAENNYINKSPGYYPGNFLRTYSEPQEDEYCGT